MKTNTLKQAAAPVFGQQQIVKAKQLRDKVVSHCQRGEYFDVLTQAQLACSKLLQLAADQEQDPLQVLRVTNKEAFSIVKDCFFYKSIAYLQMDQYQQSIDLVDELLKVLSADHPSDRKDRLHALTIKAKGLQLQGKYEQAAGCFSKAKDLTNDQEILKGLTAN